MSAPAQVTHQRGSRRDPRRLTSTPDSSVAALSGRGAEPGDQPGECGRRQQGADRPGGVEQTHTRILRVEDPEALDREPDEQTDDGTSGDVHEEAESGEGADDQALPDVPETVQDVAQHALARAESPRIVAGLSRVVRIRPGRCG